MLTNLRLENFKSAKNLEVPLRPLTVLAGLNGSGKSSILQAIGLLKQSLDDMTSSVALRLRGPLVQLGRSEDVHFEGAETDGLLFQLNSDLGCVGFRSFAKKGADTLDLRVDGDFESLREKLAIGFQFIHADRITPATQYAEASTPDQESGWLGCRGEFTIDFLQRNESFTVSKLRQCNPAESDVDPKLLSLVAPTEKLGDQTAAWMQLLSPGVRFRAIPVELADATSLRFQYTGTDIDSTSREHRPTHVGFGLTYCLPIIVACLSATSGALLLLENPEAHLHPRGQAALGRLLAQCCLDGVQIIVETHSDHLLNGIRVAVKKINEEAKGHAKEEAKVNFAESVALHYFSRNVNTGESTIDSPRILPDGQLDRWPSGFFDQWDRSLDLLLE